MKIKDKNVYKSKHYQALYKAWDFLWKKSVKETGEPSWQAEVVREKMERFLKNAGVLKVRR